MAEHIHPDETPFGKIHTKRQANRKVRCIRVAEWGTAKKPLLLYAYPLTVNDVIALDGKYESQAEQNVMQIIRQCMNGNGDPYFTLENKPALLNEPSDIIGRVLIALNGETDTFTEVLKKNNR
jgi:hypothetical protein